MSEVQNDSATPSDEYISTGSADIDDVWRALRKTNALLERIANILDRGTIHTSQFPRGGGPY